MITLMSGTIPAGSHQFRCFCAGLTCRSFLVSFLLQMDPKFLRNQVGSVGSDGEHRQSSLGTRHTGARHAGASLVIMAVAVWSPVSGDRQAWDNGQHATPYWKGYAGASQAAPRPLGAQGHSPVAEPRFDLSALWPWPARSGTPRSTTRRSSKQLLLWS